MSTQKYQQLKGETTGTKEGLEKLWHIWKTLKKDDGNIVEMSAILVRARGRVIADLLLKGEIESDDEAAKMGMLSKVYSNHEKFKRGEITIAEAFDFLQRHGE